MFDPETPGENLILQPVQPTRADAVKNRLLILDTAKRLFDEQGVDTVSMSAIADAAEIGKGTLYRHFENKIALCEALLDADQRNLQARTFERMRHSISPCETLRWFMLEVVAFVGRNRLFLGVQPGPHTLVHSAHWWWRQTIRGLLSQMNPTTFTNDLDFLTDVLYIMVDIQSINYQQVVRGYSIERIKNGMNATLDRLLEPRL